MGFLSKKKKTTVVKTKIRIINFIFQRIFRINSETPWSVHYTSSVLNPKNIKIGRSVAACFTVSGHCYIQGLNGIKIGDDTLFAPGVKIISSSHDVIDHHAKNGAGIVIGKHCWLGANSVVLAGVEIGDNVVVGAGAVVTKSVPSGVIVVGVPARIICKLDDKQTEPKITRRPFLEMNQTKV